MEVIIAILFVIGAARAQQCNSGLEEYKECGSSCPKTCANFLTHDRIKCPDICKKGCFCKSPYIRDEENGECLHFRLIDRCKTKPKCEDPNEDFKGCGTTCPLTCGNYYLYKAGHIVCNKRCRSSCFCKDPYLRDEKTGRCTLSHECSYKTTCDDPNEEFKECGTLCPTTCQNRNEPNATRNCPEKCKMGCFCKQPFIRDNSAFPSKCVPTDGCPKL